MKKTMIWLFVAGIMGIFLAGTAWADRIDTRQIRQRQRIHQGVHSGALTRGELRTLVRQQHHIRQAKRRAWRDGRLTLAEQARLERYQDRASRSIYGFKHNHRKQR